VRCDRKQPTCDRCTEKSEACAYPGTRQRGLGRRRTVRDLEERIVELEGLLRAANLGAVAHASEQAPYTLGPSPLPPPSQHDAGLPFVDLSVPEPPANQLVSLDLFEQLPSFDLMDALTALFFQNIHIGAPMLHQASYTAALRLPPHMRPPMCLQYIVMASAAATSPAYRHLSEPFYQRARVYAEADELRGQGEVFTTVAHVQSWCLISAFECHVYAIFTRASTSLCRAVRIAQMLGLHQLDGSSDDDDDDDDDVAPRSALPSPRNRVEAEERRRTWWVVFLADRYLASTTGWPSLVDEQHIRTHLPCSEEAFAAGVEDARSTPYAQGLELLRLGRDDDRLSSFAIRILAANSLLQALDHAAHHHHHHHHRRPRPGENYTLEDPYWRRHREIDTALVTLTTTLVPTSPHDPRSSSLDAILARICAGMATLQLHRGALRRLLLLLQHPTSGPGAAPSSSGTILAQHIAAAESRLLPAATAIVSAFRTAAASGILPAAIRNPLLPFAAYTAASVFLADVVITVPTPTPTPPLAQKQSSSENLAYLAGVLSGFADTSPLVRANAVQLAVDVRRAGYDAPGPWDDGLVGGGRESGGASFEILAAGGGGGGGKGSMLFCPALTAVAAMGEEGENEGLRDDGGWWWRGGGFGSGSQDGGPGLSDHGIIPGGAAVPTMVQVASPSGLFSQLVTADPGVFLP